MEKNVYSEYETGNPVKQSEINVIHFLVFWYTKKIILNKCEILEGNHELKKSPPPVKN